MEIASGKFPYRKWNSVFDQLTEVVQGQPPRLDPEVSATVSYPRASYPRASLCCVVTIDDSMTVKCASSPQRERDSKRRDGVAQFSLDFIL